MSRKLSEQERAKRARQKEREKKRRAKEREKLRRKKKRERKWIRQAPKRKLHRWSRFVKSRDGRRCVVCGQETNIQAHHILPKERYPEFKLQLVNGISLCASHHKFGKYSAHHNPVWFTLWLKKNRPKQFKWVAENLGEHGDST